MPPVEFEPTISAGERPQNYALDRAAMGPAQFASTLQKYFFTKSFGVTVFKLMAL
jgi:hypothetical protein